MRTPRAWVDRPLGPGAVIVLPEPAARHLGQVLRLRAGDPVILFNGDGRDYRGEIAACGRNQVTVRILDAGPLEDTPRIQVHLALGITKAERFSFALQKATELGVTRITPLVTERTQFKLSGPRLRQREEHWRGILVGACEQSGRRRLPVLETVSTLPGWLEDSAHSGCRLTLDPTAPIGLSQIAPPVADICLLAGPEGGLSADEQARAAAAGLIGVRLGPRILRAETAPLAAIAAVQTLWGDFAA